MTGKLLEALEQHETYCRTLERLGLSLVKLPPDPAFPDSTFVEDAAIVTSRGAILTRPGAPSRAGEVAALGAALGRWFPELDGITAPGTVDGGDVCEAGEHFFIRVSGRTNAEGAAQLAAWLAAHGFGSSTIDLREVPGLLHLKTGLAWLGGRRLLAVGWVAGHEALAGELFECAAELGDMRIAQRHFHEAPRELRFCEDVLEQHADARIDRFMARFTDKVVGCEWLDRVAIRVCEIAPHDLEIDLVLVLEVAIEGADRHSRFLRDFRRADGVVAV
jgi:hypothetical protein